MSEHNESIRELVRTSTPEEFSTAHTKKALLAMCEQLEVPGDQTKAANKAALVELIYAKYPAPDPTLRGESSVGSPVARVWALAESMFQEAKVSCQPKPRRKDVVAAGMEQGIAYYTVRTQFQAWFRATNSGTVLLGEQKDPGKLPKGLKELLA